MGQTHMMPVMRQTLAAVTLGLWATVAPAQSLLDEAAERFDPARAPDSIALLNKAQLSLVLLSDALRDEEAPDLSAVPLSDWEMQNIAVPNAILGLQGTILIQEVRIATLQLALFRAEGASEAAIALAEMRLEDAQARLTSLIDTEVLAD